MHKELILSGTSEELKSPRALKILAAAVYSGIPVTRKTSSSKENGSESNPRSLSSSSSSSSLTPPPPSSSSSLVLSYDDETRIGTTNAALRFIASLSPAASLLGETQVQEALVDGWLSFAWSSIDLPLQVLLLQDTNKKSNNKDDFISSLTKLDQHLLYQTYMVGNSITLADIRLLVSLYTAAMTGVQQEGGQQEQRPLWDVERTELINLARWYQTLIHQEWFQQSLKSLDDSSSLAQSSSKEEGLLLNGTPTPVVNKMYRRHRVRIKEVLQEDGAKYMGQSITVAGWARTIRKASSKLFFVELNDGSTGTSLQCVLDIQTTQGFEECKANGGTGASFQFVGKIVPSQGQEQPVDMQVTQGKLLGAVYGGNVQGTEVGGMLYPMSKKEHTLEHMRENAHLRPRGQIHAAAMRIRHAMAFATHNFFHNHGFLYIHTPIVTGADCEGAGEQFAVTSLLGSDHLKPGVTLPFHEKKELSKSELKRLQKKKAKADPNKPQEEEVVGAVDYNQDFFAQRVNLTVSGQLNVETHACALCDVYTFGPTFRAEESRTYRHLAEFWMIEPEIAFADLSDDMDLAEDYLKYCVQFALDNCADDLEFFENNPHGEQGLRDRLRNVLHNEFKRLTYTEAIEILQKAVADGVEFEVKPEWGIDLPSEHERYICEKVFNKPVVLVDYPKDIKAFYMKLNDDGKTVAAADVLVPKIGEIIGGSQREHRFDVLKRRCVEMGLDPRSVWWYLELRRYGTIPHAGFGLGFERLILFITGLDNIRDVIPFPRWVGNAKF